MAEKKLLCHQCRAPKSNVVFYYCTKDSCKLKYCKPCLKKRYSPEEELNAKSNNWLCPKSRGECDCSVCRKAVGLLPIGHLSSDEQKKYIEMLDCTREQLAELEVWETMLPEATIPHTMVAGIEMDTENVGPALQFLEFCRVFSPALIIEYGKPQRILEEITQGKAGSNIQSSFLEKFQSDLLNIIMTKKKTRKSCSSSTTEDAWVADIRKLIDRRPFFRTVPREYFQSGCHYHELDARWKLLILNFLCQLALGTRNLRSFIARTSFTKGPMKIENKWKELPSSLKAIDLWKNLKEEEARAARPPEDGTILTCEEEEEYRRRLMQLKEEFRNAYLQMSDDLQNNNIGQERDARGVKPLMLYTNGRRCFKIDGRFIVQDVPNKECPTSENNIDKWYGFAEEDERVVKDHFSSKRVWEEILRSVMKRVPTKIWRKHVIYFDQEQEGPDQVTKDMMEDTDSETDIDSLDEVSQQLIRLHSIHSY